MSFGSLKTKIQSWTKRSDTEFVNLVPEFIRLAEDDIYADLRCPHNEFIALYTSASDPLAHTVLPENFKELKLVTWNGGVMTPISDVELANRLYAEYDTSPVAFSLIGRQFRTTSALDDDPSNWEDSDVLVITYWGTESLNDKPVNTTLNNPVDSTPTEMTTTAISQTDTNTTRLYEHAPGVYLHGALHYAYLWLRDDQKAAMHGAKFSEALSRLTLEGKRSQYAGGIRGRASPYGD